MVNVEVKAIAENGTTKTWSTQVDESDPYVGDRLNQAGGDLLLAAAITAIHTYDIFPPRKD